MSRDFTKIIHLLFVLLIMVSCGKSDEEQINSAIREARYHLTTMDCDAAFDALDDVDEDKDNAEYVAVYASALACEAGYSDLTHAYPNIANINTTDATDLLKSFAAFSTSDETEADSETYTKLLEAINYILDADGGSSPSTTARIAKYGSVAGNDLSMQALLMIMVTYGKYLAFYGNAATDGTKGGGSVTGGNNCYTNYGELAANTSTHLSEGATGSCVNNNTSHSDLDVNVVGDATIVQRRLCEGIMLFQNMLDILTDSNLSSNASLGDLSEVEDTVNTMYTAATTHEGAHSAEWGEDAITTIETVTSQTACEALDLDDIYRYFIIIFEMYHL